MTLALFPAASGMPEHLDDGAVLLRGWATDAAAQWIAAAQQLAAQAPWRSMQVPGGQRMSVATTNAGQWGWVSDLQGYRYSAVDPHSGQPWPALPGWLKAQARAAAAAAGYAGFAPDACLLNRYRPGAKMGLHRDQDEADMAAPIVSVSLGLPCTFLWGGLARQQRPRRLELAHGDVLVWGGPSRLVYHGVAPLGDGLHPLLGSERWNLTLRMARRRYLGAQPD